MVGPEAFTEVRYLAHLKQQRALDVIPEVSGRFAEVFGRDSGGLVHPYRIEDADVVVVALGSVLGTLYDTIDELRETGARIGALGITSFRPFPARIVRELLGGARRVVVLERAFSLGSGGIVTAELRLAFGGVPVPCHTVVAGLGGRPVTKRSLHFALADALADTLEPLVFLDLDRVSVERELARAR
ncbi:transketolase C-terminal domain-containing protein [Amycolatopsis sacchari]